MLIIFGVVWNGLWEIARATKTDQERVSLAHPKMVVLVAREWEQHVMGGPKCIHVGASRTCWTMVCFQMHNENSSSALGIHIHKNLLSTLEEPYENPIAWLDPYISHPLQMKILNLPLYATKFSTKHMAHTVHDSWMLGSWLMSQMGWKLNYIGLWFTSHKPWAKIIWKPLMNFFYWY